MVIEINGSGDISLTVSESKTSETVVEVNRQSIEVGAPRISLVEAAKLVEDPSIIELLTGARGTAGPSGPAGSDGVPGEGIYFSDTPLTGMTQPYLRIGLDVDGNYTLFLGLPDA